jgi:P pilus assembly chaperone PapD
MKNRFLSISTFGLSLIAVLLGSQPLLAQGDLMVIPTRVVLESNKRFEVLTVLNRGVDSAQYTINFIQYRMTEKGELQEITAADAGASVASEIVRYFPKQVFLAPGESQTVRVQVTKPEGLPEGEYRSHLYFRSVPLHQRSEATPSSTDTSELSVKITPVFGVSVPVIVRNGELTATVGISDPQVVDAPNGKMIRFQLDRSGTKSVYGEISMDLVMANGETKSVGGIKGVSVYTPLTRREVVLPITLSGNDRGTLRITYKQKTDGRETVLATKEISIP